MLKNQEDLSSFTSIDPLWEKYSGWTPYHYCGNNPVSLRDPTGYIIEWDNAVDKQSKNFFLDSIEPQIQYETFDRLKNF